MNEFKKVELKDLILEVSDKNGNGQEYLGYFNNKHYYFTPSSLLVDEFKAVIGNKWSTGKKKRSFIENDLESTRMVFSGLFVVASGGLCPSGVRLFEVSDINNIESLCK